MRYHNYFSFHFLFTLTLAFIAGCNAVEECEEVPILDHEAYRCNGSTIDIYTKDVYTIKPPESGTYDLTIACTNGQPWNTSIQGLLFDSNQNLIAQNGDFSSIDINYDGVSAEYPGNMLFRVEATTTPIPPNVSQDLPSGYYCYFIKDIQN